jgi:hypothetical protein
MSNFLKASAAAVIAAATVSVCAPAQADRPDPLYGIWENPVVTVWAAPKVGPGWEVDSALAQWNAVGVRTFVRVPDRSQANVTIRKKSDARMIAGGPSITGYANFTSTYGYMDYCAVSVGKTLPKFNRAYVILHELGHCMGLPDDYVGPPYESVMGFWPGEDGVYDPSVQPIDAATLQDAYSRPVPTLADYEE